jgi:two-component system, OmpR family, sensor histidine kinase KdpD
MARGRLRIYLGAAPGVGKTYAMLGEGHRRLERGTDVVVGFVEDHGRALTRALVDGLEVVPRREIVYRGSTFTEMDLDAVLARAPQVALVDELAHTNIPGCEHEKRWQDVERLLDAGIDVISTVNIQHLESLNDVVSSITGVQQRETIPDEIVRRADQIELEDMSPEALRRRMAHGNVYTPEKVDAALAHYFRVGNLTALRELALLWVADRVDEGLERYRAEHGIEQPWPARERIVVALTGGPEGDTLIRRGARIVGRIAGRELLAVHVVRSDGLTGAAPDTLARQRDLVESLGGSFHTVVGEDVAQALLDFARGVNATQLVIGVSRRNRWQGLFGPDIGRTVVVNGSGDIDVHMVTHEHAGGHLRSARRGRALGGGRLVAGWLLAVLGPALLTVVLAQVRDHLSLPSELLLFLTLAVAVALVGGLLPALVAAVLGSLLLNYYFTPPVHTFTISEPENALALVIFVVLSAAVASVVDLAARRTQQAAQAQSEAATLSTLAGTVLRGETGVEPLMERLRSTFGMAAATLLERPDDRAPWRRIAVVGTAPYPEPDDCDAEVSVSDTLALLLRGRPPAAGEQRVLGAYAAQIAAVLERERLAERARQARQLAEGNAIRTALLAAVSHDLRTPLASIKAAASSLRSTDVEWTAEDEAALLATIEESADRLDALVANLLDMSRLQTGNVEPHLRPVDLDEIVPTALSGLPPSALIELNVPEELPLVVADPGLLERVLANLVENAVRHGGEGRPVLVSASALGERVEVRVVDRGPGVPDSAKETIFRPFQRLGDAPAGSGVGLGLAVAQGFTAAIGGTLTAEDTPGGGLTMVLSLPAEVPAPATTQVPA